MSIRTIGVVGAGQMGTGIAQVFAQAGYDVHLHDVSTEAMDQAILRIGKGLDRLVAKDRLSPSDHAATLARIRPEAELATLGPLDLIIEAATEKEDIKHRIFAGLGPHLGAGTILTSNTSSISIT
ncbi:MAG: 3-hydroxyacyl-CoA dehydrogenase NAD-binding domain-containing protein, partial [Pseudomonadota bacterium]